MKLVVTGGAGFIGSHLIRAWKARNSRGTVVNLDRLTYAGSRKRLSDLEGKSGYRFIRGDVTDARVLDQALQGADALIHCAAETHVDRSITDVAPFLRTNVEGTGAVLEAAKRAGLRRIVHVSTDEVYGPVLKGAVGESAPLSPRSPYAASKAGADLLAQAYVRTYDLPVMIVRPTNIYGPAQLPEKFMPLSITRLAEGRSVPIYGDGRQRRAWLYVEDLCEALLSVLAKGKAGAVYNIAGGYELANIDMARKIVRLVGASEKQLRFVQDRPAHDRRYAMKDSRIRALGWKPKVSFEAGLKRTVAWYRENAAWWRPLTRKLREDSYHWLNRPTRPSTRQTTRAHR